MPSKSEFAKILGVELKKHKVNPQLLNNDRLHYQRCRIEARVQYLVENYDKENKNHSIIVGKREDGTKYIINGQHHCDAAMRLGILKIETYLFKSKGVAHERKVFKAFQKWQNKT